MKILNAYPLALFVVLAPLAQSAGAASTQTTMNVSATVQSSCLVSASPMLFGNYDPVGAAVTNATSAITVTCTTGTSFVVGLNAGTAAGATVSARQMSNAAQRLHYNLFSDAARSNNWGNTASLDTPAPTTATSSPSILTVYGQIPANQNVPGGAYADTITVTVTY